MKSYLLVRVSHFSGAFFLVFQHLKGRVYNLCAYCELSYT